MDRIIYLANPYGFSQHQKLRLLPDIIFKLETLGLTVWEPFARNGNVDFNDPDWAYEVGQHDKQDVINSDGIFAVCNGCPPDEGVMVELGIAIAKFKPTFIFRDDIRHCTDSGRYPLNLMLFTNMTKDTWQQHYYTSIADITNPHKALAEFARV